MVEKLLPFPEINTGRLRLRRILPSDVEDMFAITRDANVSKYMNWQPHESIEKTAETINGFCQQYETGDCFRWGITLKEWDRFIGDIHIKPNYIHNRVEVGYWIGQPYWGHGYVTESLEAIIRLCFESLGVNRIEAGHMVENAASGRVMEKAGMKCEGLIRQFCLGKDGRYHDSKLYAITRDMYPPA